MRAGARAVWAEEREWRAHARKSAARGQKRKRRSGILASGAGRARGGGGCAGARGGVELGASGARAVRAEAWVRACGGMGLARGGGCG